MDKKDTNEIIESLENRYSVLIGEDTDKSKVNEIVPRLSILLAMFILEKYSLVLDARKVAIMCVSNEVSNCRSFFEETAYARKYLKDFWEESIFEESFVASIRAIAKIFYYSKNNYKYGEIENQICILKLNVLSFENMSKGFPGLANLFYEILKKIKK